jgi:hypothetical protein
MKHIVTRAELHDMDWSDPVSKIAPKFEISDVALSKICKKPGIPKPPRGYWARLQAGKATNRTALPDRQLGMPEEIEPRTGFFMEKGSRDPAAIVIPPEPAF